MAYLWPQSLVPWLDPCGDPYAGARAFFFNAGTTTPKTTYRDADLAIPHDHPVVAGGAGRFPAIFLSGADYRVRIETASGVVIEDIDGISIPDIDGGSSGGGGDVPIEERFQTGDIKTRYDTGAHTGWVRLNGRTIGNASSGASERANDDTQALYIHLWNADPNLAVAGGRGGSAESDFAANKALALPDGRQRALIGLASMGAAALDLIPDDLFDGEDRDALGALAGLGEVALTVAQLPAHSHTGTALSGGLHQHGISARDSSAGDYRNAVAFGGSSASPSSAVDTNSAGAHTHTLSINDAGAGEAHPNVQPSLAITLYMKL